MIYNETLDIYNIQKVGIAMTTLDKIKPGHCGKIKVVGGSGALRRRLLDMGLTPKTNISVTKVAPMGDPMELYLRGYVLTLRLEDAANIEIDEASQHE